MLAIPLSPSIIRVLARYTGQILKPGDLRADHLSQGPRGLQGLQGLQPALGLGLSPWGQINSDYRFPMVIWSSVRLQKSSHR